MRAHTLELTEDQAQTAAEMAAAHGVTIEVLLVEAIGHGLAMLQAGVNNYDDYDLNDDMPNYLPRRGLNIKGFPADFPDQDMSNAEAEEAERESQPGTGERRHAKGAVNLDDDIPW